MNTPRSVYDALVQVTAKRDALQSQLEQLEGRMRAYETLFDVLLDRLIGAARGE